MGKISLLLVLATAASISQAAEISCFTNYYTANVVKFSLRAEIAGDDSISNVRTWVDGDATASTPRADRDPDYRPRVYKGYDSYSIDTGYFGQQVILLPNNLTHLTGRFDGYISDGLADGEGSDGMFRLLCSVR